MTKTQKTLLYLGLPILATLVSIPFWPERYGDSYSEQQRKIWNTQMEADSEDRFLQSFPAYYSGKDARIREIVERNNKLSEQLRKQSAPDWNATPPLSPDLSTLPPEGMTFDERLHDAETNKDADTWLLFLSSFADNPTKHLLQSMRKWVAKAHELKRPGSDFLLRAIDKREETLTVKEDKGDANTYLEKIAGFNEFKRLIDSGDFALYKALVAIWPKVHRTSMGTKLEAALEQKARQGDIIAQRQLGEYGLMRPHDVFVTIHSEKRNPRPPWIIWLAKQAKQWCPDLITIREETGTSPTRDKLDEYAAWLKKAAEAGDLTAMSLWLEYGFETLNRCSKDEWTDILRYANTLLETGYEQNYQYWGNIRSQEIIQRNYSPDSLKRLFANCADTLFARGSSRMTDEKIGNNEWNENTREYNLELLDRAERQDSSALIGYFWDPLSLVKKIKDPVVRQRCIDIIRKEAKAGDPFFMSALSNMIRNKLAEPEDPGEAIRLLEQAWALSPKYNKIVHGTDINDHTANVVESLMELYLIDSPTPDNQRKAFELAQQYLAFDGGEQTGDYRKSANFYLFLMYQKGYGTAKNKEKEQYYYRQFRETEPWIHSTLKNRMKDWPQKFDYKIPE